MYELNKINNTELLLLEEIFPEHQDKVDFSFEWLDEHQLGAAQGMFTVPGEMLSFDINLKQDFPNFRSLNIYNATPKGVAIPCLRNPDLKHII